MTGPGSRDRGQVLPFYVAMMACLLFAAFVFVVVGMAGAKRSDAQGAADAAALAAARETRDNLLVGMDLLTLTPADWKDILDGDRLNPNGACAKAHDFAASNGATAECSAGVLRFTVTTETDKSIGDTVIPGTEDRKGHASATAVIEPRCELQPGSTPTATPSPSATPGPVAIDCRGSGVVTVNPSTPGPLTKLARQFFNVRLIN
ncbi:pilus assembly protein TadG-related protein [Streptomyces sp. NBC_00347]|uniref:pilus assembly protein TadG-related protein n=1 Tax=Streptomyces sp. NBC_00347 TaxID=2975721 RepID=UPI0022558EEE|nr:pilus assembly protein TadG-related protein [Streptomyces sp. NBC_00347]MCX5122823.1 pilus assembly protein TadG-related protein [Streptomyces sp. NBC_00347]